MSSSDKPAVSVVIPLYNKRALVRRAVESVLRQDTRGVELIIVDDGSTDGSAEALEELASAPGVRLIWQPNAGEGAARNRGIAEARADLIAFLDADDLFLDGHLSALLALAAADPAAGLLATGYFYDYPDGPRQAASCGARGVGRIDYIELLARGLFPLHVSSSAVRAAVIGDTGPFLAGEPLGADLEFFVRVALQYPVALDPRPSAVYRFGVADSALTIARWKPLLPPAIRYLRSQLSRGRVSAAMAPSARNYVCTATMKYAAAGIAKGACADAVALLSEVRPETLAHRLRKAVLLGAARLLPGPAVSAYLSLRQWMVR